MTTRASNKDKRLGLVDLPVAKRPSHEVQKEKSERESQRAADQAAQLDRVTNLANFENSVNSKEAVQQFDPDQPLQLSRKVLEQRQSKPQSGLYRIILPIGAQTLMLNRCCFFQRFSPCRVLQLWHPWNRCS